MKIERYEQSRRKSNSKTKPSIKRFEEILIDTNINRVTLKVWLRLEYG